MPPGACSPGSATVIVAGAAMSISSLPRYRASLRPTLPCSNIRAPCRLLFGQSARPCFEPITDLCCAGLCRARSLRAGYFYPIDWPQISHWVRFVRAKGRCQVCGRPHGERCATWAMAGGGTRNSRLGGTAVGAGPLAYPGRGCAGPDDQGRASGGPSRPRPWPLADTGIATSRHSASGAICCMTGPSTGGESGLRCAGGEHWVI